MCSKVRINHIGMTQGGLIVKMIAPLNFKEVRLVEVVVSFPMVTKK